MRTAEEELASFQSVLPEILPERKGQFVVMHAGVIQHYGITYEEALDWAYRHLGLQRFFVQEVCERPFVAHFTRNLG